MAITRRQFVTRLGALAAAAGMGQAQIAKITEAFGDTYANGDFDWVNASGKPTVVWVHGAECTGCSTSLLSLFEDARGIAIEGTTVTTAAALDLAVGGNGTDFAALVSDHRTFATYNGGAGAGSLNVDAGGAPGTDAGNPAGLPDAAFVANIQDVLVDIIELDYHETVMNMGGDLAAQWLEDFRNNNNRPFVLVVEGAVADKDQGGAWNDASGNGVPWCSIGLSVDAEFDANNQLTNGFDHAFDEVVADLSADAAVIIPIGQCATFGGYPAALAPLASNVAGFDTSKAQSGAKGTYDFLYDEAGTQAYAAKVINVPGCPTNPWWFILTVVAVLVDIETIASGGTPSLVLNPGLPVSVNTSKLDSTRRLKATYPTAIHGPYCPRFNDWSIGNFAEKPGDDGCLQKIGCKGPAVKSLCGMHGWNAQQPNNDTAWEFGLAAVNPAAGGNRGGHCTRAGHPCMGCTEKGYPDSFVPFVNW